MKHFAELPGKIVAIQAKGNDLFVVYEQPRRWWRVWCSEFAVKRFQA